LKDNEKLERIMVTKEQWSDWKMGPLLTPTLKIKTLGTSKERIPETISIESGRQVVLAE